MCIKITHRKYVTSIVRATKRPTDMPCVLSEFATLCSDYRPPNLSGLQQRFLTHAACWAWGICGPKYLLPYPGRKSGSDLWNTLQQEKNNVSATQWLWNLCSNMGCVHSAQILCFKTSHMAITDMWITRIFFSEEGAPRRGPYKHHILNKQFSYHTISTLCSVQFSRWVVSDSLRPHEYK